MVSPSMIMLEQPFVKRMSPIIVGFAPIPIMVLFDLTPSLLSPVSSMVPNTCMIYYVLLIINFFVLVGRTAAVPSNRDRGKSGQDRAQRWLTAIRRNPRE